MVINNPGSHPEIHRVVSEQASQLMIPEHRRVKY